MRVVEFYFTLILKKGKNVKQVLLGKKNPVKFTGSTTSCTAYMYNNNVNA